MPRDGIELALRFSYIVNRLRYCGPKEAHDEFLHYLENRDNAEAVNTAISKFEGLFPYLDAIAKKSGKQFTDYEVVEAYWLGNALLKDFSDDDITDIITHLSRRGLPTTISDALKADLPSGMPPHHSFHVYYVGVGRTTGHVEHTLQNMDNCRIVPGRVADVIDSQHLAVRVRPLRYDGKRLVLGDEETRTAVYMPAMLPDIKKGDTVALHWGFACLKLDATQQENVEKYDALVRTRLVPRGTS